MVSLFYFVNHEYISFETCRRRTLATFVKIAHELMEAIMRELVGISESHCEILYHITRYVLSVISLKISMEHGDDVGVNLKDLDEIDKPHKVIETIDQWLVHKACVGHVKFGGFLLKKFEEEVRVSIKFYYSSAMSNDFYLHASCMHEFCAGMAGVMQGHCLP